MEKKQIPEIGPNKYGQPIFYKDDNTIQKKKEVFLTNNWIN